MPFILIGALIIVLLLLARLYILRGQEIGHLKNIVAERNKALAEQTRATQNAALAENNFLNKISHEMRTPMNAVIGFSELLLAHADKNSRCNGECGEEIKKIHLAGLSLLSIINDILDISKIESGKFEIVAQDYDLPSLINDTLNLHISRIADKPIEFILDIDESLPSRLWGDCIRIKQICANLLSNAFKYTPQGKVIWKIVCERQGLSDDVWMIISVTDTGIGIREDDINKLFIGYNQAAAADNRHIEGAGFSLPLTKTIVEMMDGTISVQSEYGKGSTFTVRIRQKYLVDATIGPVVAERLRNFKYGATKHLENMNLKRIRLPYAKILIVDDLRVNLEIAAGIMKPYGMQIDCVTSGAEAIEAIRQEKVKYSAIFMDHMMPGMDGIEATRIIREEIGSEYAKKVPIIVLTANAVTGNEEMFLSHGFQAFLAKPIDTKRLDAVIQKWVRDKSIEKSLVEQYIMVNGEMMLEMRSGRNRRVLPTRRSGIERRKEQENGKPQNKTAFSDSLFAKWQINGLKLAEALNSFGDEKILLHVLQIFAADSPAQLEQIRQISMEDIQNYRIIVHGFKGSLRAIYGETLAKQAGKLEQAAKDNNYDYIKAHNETFIKNMEALLNSLREMLYNTATQKPKKPAPDTQVLADLLAASKCYDIDGVDLALGELQKYEYDSDEELIIWLGETIKNMGFKEITQRLTQILA